MRTTNQRADTAKPRLLVLASTYPRWPGDPEPGFVHELAKRLAGEFIVTVLCPHAARAVRQEVMDGVHVIRYRYAPDRFETLVNDGGIVTNLKRRPWKWLLVPGFVLCLLWGAIRAQRLLQPDAIHAHWLLPQGWAAALIGIIGGTPFMVTSHGADLFALRAPPLQALKRFVVGRADAVTVVSEAMRGEMSRIGVDVSTIEVLSMGVDLKERFTPDSTQRRSDYEILFVGRLVEKKGLRYLIDAMPMVLAAHPQAFLSIVGFGPEEGDRREQVTRLGLRDHVNFLGPIPQSDLPALYRRAAVFVAPFAAARDGDREGLGLVMVEALGCGCPVVTTQLPSARDVFGDAGALECVMPGSSAALAEGILGILAAPKQARARASALRDELLPRFDWTSVSAMYARALRDITSTQA